MSAQTKDLGDKRAAAAALHKLFAQLQGTVHTHTQAHTHTYIPHTHTYPYIPHIYAHVSAASLRFFAYAMHNNK